MKNRKLIYILGPLVILIWGAIAYNIFDSIRTPDLIDQDYSFQSKNVSKTVADTAYTLLANYRDPFASGNYINPDVKPTETKKPASQVNNNVWVNWPMIEYKGIILNEKKQVALIRIENSNFLIKEGDELRQIKLLKIYNDSVLLVYQNAKKVFIKSNRSAN